MSAKYEPYELLNTYRHKSCLMLDKYLTGHIYAQGIKTSATCRPFPVPDRQRGRCQSLTLEQIKSVRNNPNFSIMMNS